MPVGSELPTSLLGESLLEPVCRNDFSRMAKVRTWSDGTWSAFSVISLGKLGTEALSSWDLLPWAAADESSFAQSYDIKKY